MKFLNRNADYITALLVAAVAIAALVVSNGFPKTPIPTDIGAGAFPRTFAILLLILCSLLVVGRFFDRTAHAETERDTTPETTVQQLVRPTVGALAMVVYIGLMPFVGYMILTVIFLAFLIWLMGFRSLVWNIVISIALTAALYLLFDYGLQVPLPVGSCFEGSCFE